jgi:serpin B
MYQFDEEDTQEGPFHLENGEQVMVDMMSQKKDFSMHFSDKVNMIDLPYGDSLFSMTVMMPADEGTTLDEFIAQDLSRENFDSWTASLSEREMPLKFPKFELSYEIRLNDILISMGMEDAFDGSKADLTGINSNGGLFITEVKHKTFITVDEVGTEAAAVTSVGIGITSTPQTFSVNRPFVFVIREQNSGTILFMGKINNPDA